MYRRPMEQKVQVAGGKLHVFMNNNDSGLPNWIINYSYDKRTRHKF